MIKIKLNNRTETRLNTFNQTIGKDGFTKFIAALDKKIDYD